MTDADLLKRYAEDQSEEAFRSLVERHLPLVYGAALRRCDRNAALATEVAQQVFSQLAREAGRLRNHQAIAGWLYVAARHAAGTLMRTERRRRERERLALAMNDLPGGAQTDWEKLRPEIDVLLDWLPEKDRTALVLRFFSGQSLDEVATALGVSSDAARMRIDRALQRVRELLVQRGITSTTVALSATLTAHAAASLAGEALPVLTLTAASSPTTVGAGALGVFAFMTSKIIPVACGVLALLAGGYALKQRLQGQRLYGEIVSLRKTVAAREQALAEQSATVKKLSAELAVQRGAASAPTVNDATPAKLTAKSAAFTAAGGFPHKIVKWTNAGRGTPSAAFETLFYGLARVDFQATSPAIAFVDSDSGGVRAIFDSLSEDARKVYGTPEFMYATLAALNREKGMRLGGLEIMDEIPDGPDHATMHYRWESDPRVRTMPARLVDGQWVMELVVLGLDDPRRQTTMKDMAESLAQDVIKRMPPKER